MSSPVTGAISPDQSLLTKRPVCSRVVLPAVSTVALGLGITGAVIEGIATGQLYRPLLLRGRPLS